MNTIIEKIRAEIERRMRICERVRGEGGENQDYYHGKAVSYNETLTFLSDLEKECEEKPTNIDFEQELYKHFGQVKDFTLGMRIGKYFYELGKQEKLKDQWSEEDDEMLKRCCTAVTSSDYFFTYDERCAMEDWLKSFHLKVKSEKPTTAEGLEEEMDKFFETMPVLEHENIFEDTFKNIARHFAQWGAEHAREQMMKEAVEGEVTETCGIASVWIKTKQFKPGQKVRIIIIAKED